MKISKLLIATVLLTGFLTAPFAGRAAEDKSDKTTGKPKPYILKTCIVSDEKFGGDMEFIEFFVWRVASTTFMSMIAVTVTGQWQLPSGIVWFWLFLGATADIVISRALYYLALRRLSISLHTLVLTLSPIMAALWSLLLFGIVPSAQQLVGGLAVISGIAVVSLARRNRAAG